MWPSRTVLCSAGILLLTCSCRLVIDADDHTGAGASGDGGMRDGGDPGDGPGTQTDGITAVCDPHQPRHVPPAVFEMLVSDTELTLGMPGVYRLDTSDSPPTLTGPGGEVPNATLIEGSALGFVDDFVILAATSITIESGTTLRAEGSRSLIIAAVDRLYVRGNIDVSSGATPGAGANPDRCEPLGVGGDGAPSGQRDVFEGAGGGGGALGHAGGNGGDGQALGSTLAGGAGGTLTNPDFGSTVYGGCPGGAGSSSTGSDTGGVGGSGGGAVQLSSCSMLIISGNIYASGAGGAGGLAQLGGGGGGGGGGSGGFIGLDANSVIFVEPSEPPGLLLIAHGGGGGAGGTAIMAGEAGESSAQSASPASGGGQGDGRGGDGGTKDMVEGGEGTSFAIGMTGGGGGGGGVGSIKVNTITAMQSEVTFSPDYGEY